jgi:hypothetical protein
MVTELRLPLFPDMSVSVGPLTRQEHLTFKANRSSGRHGWLRLTPAYSVKLVESLVAHHSAQDVVLDPFCGTGTTALACAQAGIRCDTVDINPFLVWLADAKCASYSEADIHQAEAILDGALRQPKHSAWLPGIKDIEKWWPPETLAELAPIFATLSQATASAQAKALLDITFCKVLIQVAAVSFGHQSMSFKKGVQSTTLLRVGESQRLCDLFRKAFGDIAASAREAVPEGLGHAFLGDARKLESVPGLGNKYTVVITSPPYPNRMSYIRELRPYMYWLGFLSSGRQAGELDWKAIGGTWGCATSNLARWLPDPDIQILCEGFKQVIEDISVRSSVLGKYVFKYFQDTVRHVRSLHPVLQPGASLYYVVGNSKFYDVLLPVEEIYAAIFRAEGLGRVTIERIRKRSSKKELFEFVVHARA